MPTLAIIRHGQTDWNLNQRVQGISDIPLNDTGLSQARALADRLTSELDLNWSQIFSSPLGRAMETVRPLANLLELNIVEVPGFRERNYGKGEGLVWKEIQRLYGDEVPGRETHTEVRARAIPALLQITSEYPEGNGVLMSHGGTIRTVLQSLTRGQFPPAGVPIENTGVTLVHYSESRFWLDDFEPVERDWLENLLLEDQRV